MTAAHHIKAHLPVIIDYIGLGIFSHLLTLYSDSIASAIALIVYASQTLGSERCSPVFAVVYGSLVIGHFLCPIPRRTPLLYGVLLAIGIVSTIFYAVGISQSYLRANCRHRPRRMRIPSHHRASPRCSHQPTETRNKPIAT